MSSRVNNKEQINDLQDSVTQIPQSEEQKERQI